MQFLEIASDALEGVVVTVSLQCYGTQIFFAEQRTKKAGLIARPFNSAQEF